MEKTASGKFWKRSLYDYDTIWPFESMISHKISNMIILDLFVYQINRAEFLMEGRDCNQYLNDCVLILKMVFNNPPIKFLIQIKNNYIICIDWFCYIRLFLNSFSVKSDFINLVTLQQETH